MGIPPKGAALYIEMCEAINTGVLAPLKPRSPENSTPTSFEQFVREVLRLRITTTPKQNQGQ
jgi:hypothetical protein